MLIIPLMNVNRPERYVTEPTSTRQESKPDPDEQNKRMQVYARRSGTNDSISTINMHIKVLCFYRTPMKGTLRSSDEFVKERT
jgi:hypothetical protein